jgi:hypothetical protein
MDVEWVMDKLATGRNELTKRNSYIPLLKKPMNTCKYAEVNVKVCPDGCV